MSTENFPTDIIAPIANKYVRKLVFNDGTDLVHPENISELRYWDIFVEWRGNNTWAVTDHMGTVYNLKGDEETEPLPSSRTKKFLKKYRFSFEEAVRIAILTSKKVTMRRLTVREYVEKNPWLLEPFDYNAN